MASVATHANGELKARLLKAQAREAVALMERGDLKAGIALIQEVIETDPSERYRFTLASALEQLPPEESAGGQLFADADEASKDLPPSTAIRFDRDSKRRLIVHKNACRVWSVEGKPLAPPFRVGHVVFASFYGDWVLTVRSDGECRIWDWKTGDPINAPLRHGAPVLDADLYGSKLAVTGADGKVRVWELPGR